jgi:hypothetical protein
MNLIQRSCNSSWMVHVTCDLNWIHSWWMLSSTVRRKPMGRWWLWWFPRPIAVCITHSLYILI